MLLTNSGLILVALSLVGVELGASSNLVLLSSELGLVSLLVLLILLFELSARLADTAASSSSLFSGPFLVGIVSFVCVEIMLERNMELYLSHFVVVLVFFIT